MEGAYRYCIETTMPLGKRRGTLEIHIARQGVTGVLQLLGRMNAFQEGRYENGFLSFCGQLITPLYALPYRATGTVDESHVELELETSKGRLHTTGTAETRE